ncbi:NADPH-dependent F420 reductase [Streptomyces sp. NPDC059373]
MTVIGFIGSGNIGQAIARQAIASGHDVVMSNSRGPHTLTRLIDALGPRAYAATSEQASAAGDLVVVAIPFRNVLQIPVQPLAGKIVIDANNYFAPRDGQVPAIDNGDTAPSEILAAHLTATRVVKAFNAIMATHIIEHARPPGTPHRRAIPIAGDDDQAKRAVTEFIDRIGFDVVDAGSLVDGRRIDPMDAWGPVLDADALRAAMAARTQH